MAVVEIVLHTTCYSSYSLYRGLKAKGLMGRVKLVEARSPSLRGFLVWSVPWMLVDGRPAGADPLEVDVVEAALGGAGVKPPKRLHEAFMEAVAHSTAASSLVAVSSSLEPVLDEALASAAARSPLTGVDPREVLEEVSREGGGLLEEWLPRLGRALAVAFAREAWWSRGGSLTPEELEGMVDSGVFRLWLLAKASLGRAGLPRDPRSYGGPAVEEAEEFARSLAPRIVARVAEEQASLSSDGEWWSGSWATRV